jgi:hypothetical protein
MHTGNLSYAIVSMTMRLPTANRGIKFKLSTHIMYVCPCSPGIDHLGLLLVFIPNPSRSPSCFLQLQREESIPIYLSGKLLRTKNLKLELEP